MVNTGNTGTCHAWWIRTRFVLLPLLIACVGGPLLVVADEVVEDFSGGYNSWKSQWDIHDPALGGGETTISSVVGYDDTFSVRFDLDGSGDDGTLWIEKRFLVSPDKPTDVGLSFQLYNPFQSDVNNFQVKAYLGEADPSGQGDFTLLGETGSSEGWVEFDHQLPDFISRSGDAWVAAGIRVAWETGRTYHIDHVEISGVTRVPDPCDFDSDGDVDGDDFLLWQRNFPILDGTAGSSSGDANGDGNVDGDDFLVWQRNFPYPTAISSVPEPNSLALLALGGLMMLRRRRT